MTTSKIITRENLAGLVADLIVGGVEVIGPASMGKGAEGVAYRRLANAADLRFDRLPVKSLKETCFPPTEPLLRFKQRKTAVEIEEIPVRQRRRVVLAARPCDAAGLTVLDKVMNWDYKDELWNGRREATTIVSMACSGEDASCFCTAVGIGPDSGAGSDILLTPVADGYHAEILTAKGGLLVESCAARFGDGESASAAAGKFKEDARAKVAENLRADPPALHRWLGSAFDDSCWDEYGLRCHGCGACAFVCPTCHCFDIVDEMEGLDHGTRRRNWDTCQTGKFTVHASGHNPRVDQNARIRQRIMHKFYIYPERFGDTLCTGCGRCVRACPAGMDLLQILSEIGRRAADSGEAR